MRVNEIERLIAVQFFNRPADRVDSESCVECVEKLTGACRHPRVQDVHSLFDMLTTHGTEPSIARERHERRRIRHRRNDRRTRHARGRSDESLRPDAQRRERVVGIVSREHEHAR